MPSSKLDIEGGQEKIPTVCLDYDDDREDSLNEEDISAFNNAWLDRFHEDDDVSKNNSKCPCSGPVAVALIFCITALVACGVALTVIFLTDNPYNPFNSEVSSSSNHTDIDKPNNDTTKATVQMSFDKIYKGPQQPQSERDEIDFVSSNYFGKPKIIDLLGKGLSFFPLVFSECFRERNISIEHNLDFLTKTSFCKHPIYFDQNQQGQIFMVIRNPLVRTAQSFIERRNRKSSKYDKKVVKKDISDYIKSSPHEQNFLSRFLTCKFEGDLNSDDLQHAKEALDSKHITVHIFPDRLGLMNNFPIHLKSNMHREMLQCIDSQLQNALSLIDERRIHLIVGENSKILREANEYDMQLFMYILKMNTKKN